MATSALDENIDEAVALYESGATASAVAGRYGVSAMTVLARLRARGVTIRAPGSREPRRRLTADQEAALAAFYLAGNSTHAAALKFGVAQGTVSNVLKRQGVRRRGLGVERKVSDEALHALHARYLAGESIEALSPEAGYGRGGLSQAFRTAGLEFMPVGKRPMGLDDPKARALVDAYVAGGRVKATAERLGMDYKVAVRLLREAGHVVKNSGERHPNWKGGRYVTDEGYVKVLVDEADACGLRRDRGGYVAEHRLVMARWLGRPLESYEQVHHRDGNRQDNRMENLQLRHGAHGAGTVLTCRRCGSHDIEATELA